MRTALVALLVLARAAAADICAPAECAQQCGPKNTAACTFAAEHAMEGKAGWAVNHALSLRLAKRACDAKDAHGCALVGLHYQDGLGTARDPKRAIAAYEKACTAGAGIGCYNLASMYYGAHGVPFDRAKGDAYTKLARTHWERACSGGEPRWCTNLAFLDTTDDKTPEAEQRYFDLTTKACNAGVTVGCLEAARSKLALGQSDTLGYVRALDKLCTQGESGACGVLGALLVLGEGNIKQDPKRAIELLTRACDGGDKTSCYGLGMEYAAGKHVKQDFAATTKAFERACDRALSKACLAIAQNAAAARDFKTAAAFGRRACDMGNADACGMLAQLHADGSGVGKSVAQSTKFATEACRMGHMPSCGVLIKRDVFPLPVPADMQKKMLESACKDANIASACKRLR